MAFLEAHLPGMREVQRVRCEWDGIFTDGYPIDIFEINIHVTIWYCEYNGYNVALFCLTAITEI